MRENKTKTKLKQGQPVFGVISSSVDPMIAEICGFIGFDYYMIDGEHGAFSPVDAVNIVRACEIADITPLARLGSKDPKLVLQYLDTGMQGIMMPGLETVADIEMLVKAIKYPPQGKRGLGLGRAANYMLGSGADQAAYVNAANEQTLVIPQFEDPVLLEQLPDMVNVPGVDGFVFGPRDLSLTMGFADGANHADVQAIIDQAISIIQNGGLFVGTTASSPEAAQAEISRGAAFILTSIPNLLKRGGFAFLNR